MIIPFKRRGAVASEVPATDMMPVTSAAIDYLRGRNVDRRTIEEIILQERVAAELLSFVRAQTSWDNVMLALDGAIVMPLGY